MTLTGAGLEQEVEVDGGGLAEMIGSLKTLPQEVLTWMLWLEAVLALGSGHPRDGAQRATFSCHLQ